MVVLTIYETLYADVSSHFGGLSGEEGGKGEIFHYISFIDRML